ncbi:MAG: neutral/alkaline non-lysosomal ceramidase N-terminal domain-containing protein [Sandaracinaceae bacterium]|nr:neutral/alkaline non-lysosomal ceramidase N-terminal domain-containing protein [Sandaracinaceae bacterium]
MASALASPLVAGCPGPEPTLDASMDDAAIDAGGDAGPDTGPPEPAPTDHCTYEPLPSLAHAGGTVTRGPLTAGTAEGFFAGPVSATLGAYTARAENIGGQGFFDARREPVAGAFATSVGVEARPRIRVLALSTGQDTPDTADDETVLLVKTDLGVGYQGLVHEVERALGPEYAGKVLIATSHSHSGWANYHGHAALQVGFSTFRRIVFDRMVQDIVAVSREALDARVPARIGIAYDEDFDPTDQVTHDRRGENDRFAGGPQKDNRLYVIRVDTTAGEPLAMLPMFGMHGTLLDADNVIASTDAPGGLERVLQEELPRDAGSTLPPVVVMHLQGAAGDVSPGGTGSTDCGGRDAEPFCQDFAKAETVGWAARDQIMAAYEAAAESMTDTLSIEAVSRSIERGPNWENFTVRDGALRYAPFDGRRPADRMVWANDAHTELLSPIDEFNAPFGAALCGGEGGVAFFGARGPAQMPNTAYMDESYSSCNQLVPRFMSFFETALDVEIGTTPVCDTTRTTISALRLEGDAPFGRYVISTLPGEPVTLLADRMRMLAQEADPGLTDDRYLVLGYTQDNNGYLLTAEDWLSNGYEPSITFWGPLDGEMIMERAVALLPAVLSDEREDTYDGQTHVAVPSPVEDFVADESMAAGVQPGTIPASSPAYLATQAGPMAVPAQLAEGATVHRLDNVYFTWIGGHPLHGTPRVHVEQDVEGSWVPLTRASGRVVEDGDLVLTWTPDPQEAPRAGDPPRVHYWTVQWQAVPALGQRGFPAISDRLALPTGRYRFVVDVPDGAGLLGTTQYMVSREFVVAPATLGVAVERAGGNATITVTAHAPHGFRLLDLRAGANRPIPLRGVEVTVGLSDGTSRTVTLDADGHATFAAPAGAITVTDAAGNTGSG